MGHWKFTMNRKIYYWKLRTTELQLGEKTLVMGVLNITPDSFSDGGRFLDPDKAYARALEMEEQGSAQADSIEHFGEDVHGSEANPMHDRTQYTDDRVLSCEKAQH